jgi:hypothetical protein
LEDHNVGGSYKILIYTLEAMLAVDVKSKPSVASADSIVCTLAEAYEKKIISSS